MLGDSIRRRRPPPRPPRPAASRPARPRPGRRFPWGPWLLAALIVTAVSFLVGYLLATRVIFPPPVTAGAGIPVPELYGMDRYDAEDALARARLTTGTITELASLRAERGRVLAQDPVPGQQLRAGGAVALAVSAGPPQVQVPAIAGLGAGTARSVLENAGFGVELRATHVAGVGAGVVLRTEPGAGTTLRLPAVVVVVVNAGPPEQDPVGAPLGAGDGR